MDINELRAHSDDGLPFRVSLEAVNKGVGIVAFGLPFALLAVSALGNTCAGIDSISHYYYSRLGGDILVGALCFIGVLLAFFYKLPTQNGTRAMVDGYLGHSKWDMRAAKFAGVCAFGVALAPTTGPGCEDFGGTVARLFLTQTTGGHALPPPADLIDGTASFDFWPSLGIDSGVLTMIHYGSALGMFAVLAYFSIVVFPRPQSATAYDDTGARAMSKAWRNLAYRLLGGLILVAIGALIYKFLALNSKPAKLAGWNGANLTFWFEALGLMAFGLSWSLKGRLFDIFRDDGESNPRQMTR